MKRADCKHFATRIPVVPSSWSSIIMRIINPPGAEPRTDLRRLKKSSKGEMVPRRIVVCMEEVSYYAIDDWHCGQTHLGQERTWTYCQDNYYNVSQELVKHYCQTCIVCLKKNPVTEPAKGSRIQFKVSIIERGSKSIWLILGAQEARSLWGFIYLCMDVKE